MRTIKYNPKTFFRDIENVNPLKEEVEVLCKNIDKFSFIADLSALPDSFTRKITKKKIDSPKLLLGK